MTIITISDGFSYRAVYQLDGNTLEMTRSGGCDDALGNNGCQINKGMNDDKIIDTVYDSWTADGYDGDPMENELTVGVEWEGKYSQKTIYST